MTVTTNKGGKETKPFPSSGVIYVKQGSCNDIEGTTGGKHPKTIHYYWPSCLTEYSPFTASYVSYPEGRDCGSVYVHGHYAGELTIAAERDIVVDGNLTNDGDGLLGLIANKFVRIKHPVCVDREKHDNTPEEGCPSGEKPAETEKGHCNGGHNENSLSSPKIEAAILAIEHSFIVDHYDCGSSLGTLNVKGAISQKYRGAVGTTGGTGYYKNYEYDDRLRYRSRRTSSTRSSRRGTSSARRWTSRPPNRDEAGAPPPGAQGWAASRRSHLVQMAAIASFGFIGGAVTGSFLSVVAHRVPRASRSSGRARAARAAAPRSPPTTTSRSSPGCCCGGAAAAAASRSPPATR